MRDAKNITYSEAFDIFGDGWYAGTVHYFDPDLRGWYAVVGPEHLKALSPDFDYIWVGNDNGPKIHFY